MNRTIVIRVDDILHTLVKKRCAKTKTTLTDYIVSLILNDLKDRKPLNFENISVESVISEDSVNEAQKVLLRESGLLREK
jgi:hypothetical protein